MSGDNLLRINQINAIFLDNEIYKTLLQIIHDTTKYLPPGFIVPFEPEIGLILHMLILENSVCHNGSTFGQQLFSIKYLNLSKTKKFAYVLSYTLEYLRNRLELWKPGHFIHKYIFNIHFMVLILNLFNVSVFLRNGVKPLLIERLLGLKQVHTTENAPRQFQSKYLAREILWNGFIEIFIHILPLINYHKIKRTLKNFNPIHKKTTYMKLNRNLTIHSKCAHCEKHPILPHHMGCAHIFCYVCLKGNQTADSKYECPVCEHRNPNALCDQVFSSIGNK